MTHYCRSCYLLFKSDGHCPYCKISLSPRKALDQHIGSAAAKKPSRWENTIFGLGECFVCGIDKNLTIHHFVPKSKGGALHAKDNLLTTCRSCHDKIHAKPKNDVLSSYRLFRAMVDEAVSLARRPSP